MGADKDAFERACKVTGLDPERTLAEMQDAARREAFRATTPPPLAGGSLHDNELPHDVPSGE